MKTLKCTLRALTLVLASCLAVSQGVSAGVRPSPDAPESILSGRKMKIESKILQETREIWVKLPSGYENSQELYPVLIQLGGETHFLYSSAIVDFLSRYDDIPRMIVAAVIDPTPRQHYRDSTPTKVDYLTASGGAPQFLRFIKEELLPALDTEFRTRPFKILCGHGLSGLFAVYALLESPGTFKAFLTDGASLTYDNSALLKGVEKRLDDPLLAGALYLGVGNERETIPGIKTLADLLASKAPRGLDWKMDIQTEEDQGTAALPAFYDGLKWVFRAWRLPLGVAVRGIDAVKDYYRDLSGKFSYEIPVTEKTLSVLGFQLIREQRFPEAATVFEVNAAAFPESPDVHHNLAMLSERQKQWDKAAAHYETAALKAGPQRPELAQFFRRQAEQARLRAKKTN